MWVLAVLKNEVQNPELLEKLFKYCPGLEFRKEALSLPAKDMLVYNKDAGKVKLLGELEAHETPCLKRGWCVLEKGWASIESRYVTSKRTRREGGGSRSILQLQSGQTALTTVLKQPGKRSKEICRRE